MKCNTAQNRKEQHEAKKKKHNMMYDNQQSKQEWDNNRKINETF